MPEIVRPGERAWRFVFPNAPVRPVTINGGMPMRAWYDLKGLDRKAAEDVAGFQDTDAQIRELIAREVARGIPTNRVVLAGFSQGGAVSLYTAPRLPGKAGRRHGAVVLLAAREQPFAPSAHRPTMPRRFSWPTDSADTVLPMSLGTKSRDFLKAQGYTVEWHDYPMAHAVCAAEIADIRQFLFRVLPQP